MNLKLMSAYIEFIADHLLVSLKQEKVYHTPNPFDWMEMISLKGKVNFFETTESMYTKAHVRVTDSSSGSVSQKL